MNFFNTNAEQDRIYLEASNQYNLAYWIAADIDHFVENKTNITAHEYSRLISQYKLAIRILNEGSVTAKQLINDHNKCAKALKGFVSVCIKEFDFFSKAEIKDSETKEMNMLMLIDKEKDFHEEFRKYLSPNEPEAFVFQSYSYMTAAIENLMFLDINSDPERKSVYADKIVNNFKLAKETIDSALQNEDCLDSLISEFVIISSNKNTILRDQDLLLFCNKNIEYMQLWREFYSLDEQFHRDIFFNIQEVEESEFNLVNHENMKYLAKINSIAIDICKSTLNIMGAEVPYIEIFSDKLITNPISYIHQ